MEESLKTLLESHKLEHLQNRFEEVGVINEKLASLVQDDSDLKELVPNFLDRLKFEALIKSLKIDSDVLLRSVSTADTVIIEPDGSFSIPAQSPNEIVDVVDYQCAASTSAENKNISFKRSRDETETGLMTDFGCPAPKNVHARNFLNQISFTMFEDLMKSSSGSVVKEYYKNHKEFNSKIRNMLTSTIITSLVSSLDYSLFSCTISTLADHIVTMFPTECKEAYFLVTKNGKRTIYSGRLYTKYKNHRQILLSARKIEGPTSIVVEAELPEDINNKLLFLKNSISPWEDICLAWEETRAIGLENNNQSTIVKIIEMYPALKQKDGFVLVEQDFSVQYPQKKADHIHSRWQEVHPTLFKILEKEKRFNISSLMRNCSDDQYNVHMFRNLAAHLAGGVIENKAEVWRPTSSEAEELFLTIVSDISEIGTHLDARKKEYQILNLTLQPCMFKVDNSTGCSYYLITENLRYEFPTLIKCLDVTFKLHQAFNLQYNRAVTNIWIFIQRFLYGIETIYDTRSPCVCQLEKTLKASLSSS